MRMRTITICLCLVILMFGIMFKYTTWRDTKYLTEEQISTQTRTFGDI